MYKNSKFHLTPKKKKKLWQLTDWFMKLIKQCWQLYCWRFWDKCYDLWLFRSCFIDFRNTNWLITRHSFLLSYYFFTSSDIHGFISCCRKDDWFRCRLNWGEYSDLTHLLFVFRDKIDNLNATICVILKAKHAYCNYGWLARYK